MMNDKFDYLINIINNYIDNIYYKYEYTYLYRFKKNK